MDAAFTKAASGRRKSRFRCLGLPMEPLTVGHLFFLLEIQSPFATGGDVEFGDFLLAVFICSQDHREARKTIHKWWVPLLFRFLGFLFRRRNLAEEMNRFREYLVEYNSTPVVKLVGGGSGKTHGAPLVYSMLSVLMSEFGMAERDAMQMPVNHAQCLIAANGEARGHAELKDDEFDEFWAWAESQDRAKAESAAKEK